MMQKGEQIFEIRESVAGKRIYAYDVPVGWLMAGLNDSWVIQINSNMYEAQTYEEAFVKIYDIVKRGI